MYSSNADKATLAKHRKSLAVEHGLRPEASNGVRRNSVKCNDAKYIGITRDNPDCESIETLEARDGFIFHGIK